MSLVEFLRSIAQTIATLVEGIGVAIVAVAVIVATVRYVVGLLGRIRPFPPEGLRLGLGRRLVLNPAFRSPQLLLGIGLELPRSSTKPR